MDLLSRDVLVYLTQFLETASLTRFSMVNRRMYALIGKNDKVVRWRSVHARWMKNKRFYYTDILDFACAENDIELLQYCDKRYGRQYRFYGTREASKRGHVCSVEFYISCGVDNRELYLVSMTEACTHGHFDLVKFLLKRGVFASLEIFELAITNRHFDVANLVLAFLPKNLDDVFVMAIRTNFTCVAKFLVSEGHITSERARLLFYRTFPASPDLFLSINSLE